MHLGVRKKSRALPHESTGFEMDEMLFLCVCGNGSVNAMPSANKSIQIGEDVKVAFKLSQMYRLNLANVLLY